MAEIIISNEQDKTEVTEEIKELINSVCDAVLSEEECDFTAEISVTFVDNEGIRAMNNEFRGIDRATDVLSFPMLEFDDDEAPAEYEYDGDCVMLGDIVLSLERAKEQAEEYNHSLRREIAFLTAHSMLHLLGYDHENDPDGEKTMIEKQEKILMGLNITRDN